MTSAALAFRRSGAGGVSLGAGECIRDPKIVNRLFSVFGTGLFHWRFATRSLASCSWNEGASHRCWTNDSLWLEKPVFRLVDSVGEGACPSAVRSRRISHPSSGAVDNLGARLGPSRFWVLPVRRHYLFLLGCQVASWKAPVAPAPPTAAALAWSRLSGRRYMERLALLGKSFCPESSSADGIRK